MASDCGSRPTRICKGIFAIAGLGRHQREVVQDVGNVGVIFPESPLIYRQRAQV